MVNQNNQSKLRTVLAQKEGGRLNGTLKTPWLSCILNAALLNLKLYCLQAETFLQKNGFVIYFFNGVSKISAIIFHSQFRVEKKVMQDNFAFHESNFFFFKCPPLHISQINSSLDVKRNKKVLDNKRSEPLHITVSWMDHWFWGYISLYIWANCFLKN